MDLLSPLSRDRTDCVSAIMLHDGEYDDVRAIQLLNQHVKPGRLATIYVQGSKCTPDMIPLKTAMYEAVLKKPSDLTVSLFDYNPSEVTNFISKLPFLTLGQPMYVLVTCPPGRVLRQVLSLVSARAGVVLISYSGNFNLNHEVKNHPTMKQELMDPAVQAMLVGHLDISRYSLMAGAPTVRDKLVNTLHVMDFKQLSRRDPVAEQKCCDFRSAFNWALVAPHRMFFNYENLPAPICKDLSKVYASGDWTAYHRALIHVAKSLLPLPFVSYQNAEGTRAWTEEAYETMGSGSKRPFVKPFKMGIFASPSQEAPTADIYLAVVLILLKSNPEFVSVRRGHWDFSGRFTTFRPDPNGLGIETVIRHELGAAASLIDRLLSIFNQ